MPALIVKGRDDSGERRRRVDDGAPVTARVGIGRRTLDVDLEIGQPTE
jgi:hypothetical protein